MAPSTNSGSARVELLVLTKLRPSAARVLPYGEDPGEAINSARRALPASAVPALAPRPAARAALAFLQLPTRRSPIEVVLADTLGRRCPLRAWVGRVPCR